MTLAKKILENTKNKDESSIQDVTKKHSREVEKAVDAFFKKTDLWGFHNNLIKKLAKKDGLDVADLHPFDIEPYEILIKSRLVKSVNSMS